MNSKQGGLVECSARKKIKRSQAHERRSKKPSGRNRTPGTKVKSGGLMVCSARKTKEVVGLVACSTQKMGEEGGWAYARNQMNSKRGLRACSARKKSEGVAGLAALQNKRRPKEVVDTFRGEGRNSGFRTLK
jgi:hypothetical protein